MKSNFGNGLKLYLLFFILTFSTISFAQTEEEKKSSEKSEEEITSEEKLAPNQVQFQSEDPASQPSYTTYEKSARIIPESDVNNHGAFTYNYVFTVPKGIEGMQPSLSISYNSQNTSNTSMLGYGWSLDIPMISRRNTTGIDKIFSQNNFSSSLSGDLIQVSGNDYVPRFDDGTYLKYTFINNLWIIKDKQGNVYEFGNTNNARLVDPNNSTQVSTWYVSKITNRFGISVEYKYNIQSDRPYLSSINYGKVNGNSVIDLKVELQWENRPDKDYSANKGFLILNDKRLKTVSTRVNNTLVRKYTPEYQNTQISGRSLLIAIKEEGYNGDLITTLPQTLFNYTVDEADRWNWTGLDYDDDITIKGINGRTYPLDVNGDGFTDILEIYQKNGNSVKKAYLHNQDSRQPNWEYDRNWSNEIPNFLLGENASNQPSYVGGWFGDVNGDFLVDIVSHTGEVYLNDRGEGWDRVTNWSNKQELPPALGCFLLNVNGDGKDDLICFIDDDTGLDDYHDDLNLEEKVWLSTGTGWEFSQNWSSALDKLWASYRLTSEDGSIVSNNRGVRFQDVNNDGLVDYLRGDRDIFINTGSGWVNDPARDEFEDLLPSGAVFLADINGDGLLDHLEGSLEDGEFEYDVNLNKYIPNGQLNNFSEWSHDSEWFKSFRPSRYGTSNNGNRLFFFNRPFMDINGDGMTDIYPNYLNPQFQPPDLLRSVTTPKGATISVRYDGALTQKDASNKPLSQEMPFPKRVVAQRTINDQNGNNINTNYNYHNGKVVEYYDQEEDGFVEYRFAGFEIIDAETNGRLIRRYFHQGQGTNYRSYGETTDRLSKLGKLFRQEVFERNPNSSNSFPYKLYEAEVFKWEESALTNGSVVNYLGLNYRARFDGDGAIDSPLFSENANKFIVATDYEFDETLGEIIKQSELGVVESISNGEIKDIGNDTRETSFYFATNNDGWVFPSGQKQVDVNNMVFSETKMYFDNLPFLSVNLGNISKSETLLENNNYTIESFEYNDIGQVVSSIDPMGNKSIYTYDLTKRFQASTTNALNQIFSTTFNDFLGLPLETINPNNYKERFEYDGLGRLIKRNISVADGSSLVTVEENEYHTESIPQSQTRTIYPHPGTAGRKSITYFDGLGRNIQAKQLTETGKWVATDLEYDLLGRQSITSLPYETNNNDFSSITNQAALLIKYEYDALDRVTKEENTLGSTQTIYDGFKTTIKDANQNQKDLISNAFDNLVKVVEYNEGQTYTTTYEYDVSNNLKGYIDAENNRRDFSFDKRNLRLSASDLYPIGTSMDRIHKYTYDDYGNVLTITQPNGITESNTYDVLNRVKATTVSSGENISYTYDTCLNGQGKLCKVEGIGIADNQNIPYAIDFSYNHKGNLSKRMVTINQEVIGFVEYEYNNIGELTTTNYSNQASVHRVLNIRGLPEEIEYLLPDSSGYQSQLTFGANGLTTSIQHPNGVITNHTYDSQKLYRRTKTTTIGQSNSKIQDISYAYDPTGNILNIVDLGEPITSKNVTYEYDNLYRLKKATATNTGNNQDYSRSYSYSPTGNILSSSDLGDYQYSNTGNANPQAVTQAGNISLTYDKNGNVIGSNSTQDGNVTHQYNYQNQITKSTLATNDKITYLYDDTGQRLARFIGPKKEFYLGPDFSILDEKSQITISALGATLATFDGDDLVFNHTDHLNSSSITTSLDSAIVEIKDYYPFGAVRIQEEMSEYEGKAGFTGHDFDVEADLTYANARYYQQNLCKWMSSDRVQISLPDREIDLELILFNPQNLNGYSYGRNNPSLLIDKDGKLPHVIITAGIGALAGGITSIAGDLIRGEQIDWRRAGSKALKGAVSGAIVGATGGAGFISAKAIGGSALINKTLNGAIKGGLETGLEATYNELTDNNKGVNGRKILHETAQGALEGALFGAISNVKIKGINKGRGSFLAVSKQLATKFDRHLIKRITVKSGLKIIGAKVIPEGVEKALNFGVEKSLEKFEEAKQNKLK